MEEPQTQTQLAVEQDKMEGVVVVRRVFGLHPFVPLPCQQTLGTHDAHQGARKHADPDGRLHPERAQRCEQGRDVARGGIARPPAGGRAEDPDRRHGLGTLPHSHV